jgi:hypothetical protein
MLGACIVDRENFTNFGMYSRSGLWNISDYPPPEVRNSTAVSPSLLKQQESATNSCSVLRNVRALKIIAYDNFGEFVSTGSAVALNWNGKTVYVTNRHITNGRAGFFLIDASGNWTETRVINSEGNIFSSDHQKDSLKNMAAIDLALLAPENPDTLSIKSSSILDTGSYNGPVGAMGFPSGTYGWTIAESFSEKNYLVVYNEEPFYSQSGTSGGGVYSCETGNLVGLTFSTPFLPFVVDLKTNKFKQVKVLEDLKDGELVAQYAIHASQIRTFLLNSIH